MKKKFSFLFLFGLLTTMQLAAQTPNAFQYQTVIRNADGTPASNLPVNFRFKLLKAITDVSGVFTETQTATTNSSGVISLQIVDGTPGAGSLGLGEVDWTQGTYFMQVEIDKGSGYSVLSSQQLLSTPYAKYAQAAGNLRIKSPDGSTWNVTIGDDGQLTATKVQ
jgi:hypothetical protein